MTGIATLLLSEEVHEEDFIGNSLLGLQRQSTTWAASYIGNSRGKWKQDGTKWVKRLKDSYDDNTPCTLILRIATNTV